MAETGGRFFLHPQGLCETEAVGEGTRIWAFAHVLKGAVIGRNCNICDGVFVEADVTIGDETTVKSGVQLWNGVRLGHSVFVGPNVTFTNDSFPRSKRYPSSFPKTVVKDGASIGANATIMPGIQIGERAMIGAGSVVLNDVPARAVVVGNPTRVVGYADAQAVAPIALPSEFPVKCIQAQAIEDERGRLTAREFGELPFLPRRMFTIDLVNRNGVRGGHAHRECAQIFTIMAGAVTCALDDGSRAYAVRLTDPTVSLFVPTGIWVLLFDHTDDAVLTVLASHPYSADDYVSDYASFCRKDAAASSLSRTAD
jgi:UDP-2-acetamido-3-amino-2,3-dideoxy-glucuronate N-acetyltransferase